MDPLTIKAPPPHLLGETGGKYRDHRAQGLEVVWITTKKTKTHLSPRNKGIGSRLIKSEQNSELVHCSKSSVSSLQRLVSNGWDGGPWWRGSVLWRCFYWGWPSTQLAKQKVLLSSSFFMFTSGSFLIFAPANGRSGRIASCLHTLSKSLPVACTLFLSQFQLNLFPLSLLTSLTTRVSYLHWVNKMKNGSAENSGIHLAFCVHWLCIYVHVQSVWLLFTARSTAICSQKKKKRVPSFGWACVHVLVWQGAKGYVSWISIHSRSQGLEGVFGLSGVEDFKEREKQKRQKRRKQRWVEMGRIARRQTADDLFYNERRKHKIQWILRNPDPHLSSPSSKWRSRLKSSEWGAWCERNISRPTREKPWQKIVHCSDLRSTRIHSARGKRKKKGWRGMKARALE